MQNRSLQGLVSVELRREHICINKENSETSPICFLPMSSLFYRGFNNRMRSPSQRNRCSSRYRARNLGVFHSASLSPILPSTNPSFGQFYLKFLLILLFHFVSTTATWFRLPPRLAAAAAAAKSLQSCPTLCDPIDGSPPGSPVPGILQARTLEWVAISFSNAWKWKVKVKSLSHVRLLVTSYTAAYQAPPPMGFSRQECWSGKSTA